jgi:hypothetical protein
MKNITLSGTWRAVIEGGNITTIVIDVVWACLWIASERLNADADIEIDIYKRGLPDDSYEMGGVSTPLENLGLWILQIHCHHR